MPLSDDTFFVVGNGPSLSTRVLDQLQRGRWLGMNAAYKYWDKSQRYPHFYACLDPVLVVQHKDAIARLAEEDDVAELLLHEAVFESMPELRDHPKVTARDAFLAETGVLPVSAMSKHKQTTGVLATRFCIERGFENLCLLGIDCNYVEQLDEAQTGDGIELIIKDTVRHNPNYFFDNYQEKNEKYQVPNPPVHSGNLHLQSFIALRGDIEASGKDVTIGVGSHDSLLERYGVFPYLDVESVLGLRKLGAVAVPLMPHELDGFLDRLETWVDPKLQPSLGPVNGVALHLFLACAEDKGMRAKILATVKSLPWLARYFADFRVTFLQMAEEVDYYIKGTSLNVFCNKSGPNLFWLMVMAGCRDYAYVFQMEADCLPLRAGWLDALDRAIAYSTPGAWVIGTNYAGPTVASPTNAFHVNGNAIYATANRSFQDFLEKEFLDALAWLITNVSNNIAYDVAYAQGISQYDAVLEATGIDLRKFMHRFVHTPIILNMGGSAELQPDSGIDLMAEVRKDKDAFLGHGRPFITLTEMQLDRFESTFQDDICSVSELRPHSFAAVPPTTDWQYQGYGLATGTFVAKPASQTSFQFRCDVSQVWTKGDIVLSLAPDPALAIEKIEVSIRRPGKKAAPIKVTKTERNGRFQLRLGKAPSDYGTITEMVARFELKVTNKVDTMAIRGLRILFFPSADTPAPVQFVPRSSAIDAMEQRWIDWRRKGQERLSNKFRFLCNGSEALVLKDVEARPRAEYHKGDLCVSLTGDSRIRMTIDPGKEVPEAFDLVLEADRNIGATLGGTILGPEAPHTVTLSAGQPQSLHLPLRTARGLIDLTIQEIPGQNWVGGQLTVRSLSLTKHIPRLVSVNPDAESFFGHFLNYEARLGKALTQRGQAHLIAGPIDAEPQVYDAHPEMVKVFSVRSNTLYAKTPGETVPGLATFETELDRYLATLDHATPTQLFMYCGSLEIAEVFGCLADRYPSCSFAISLYYLSWLDLDDAKMQAYWAPRLAKLSKHPRIRLIVPAPELAEEMRAGFGVELEILPHPTTTFHDDELGTLQADGGSAGDARTTVVFPGNMRGGKGFDLTKDALLALIDSGVEDLRIRVRFPPADSVNKARQEFFDQIRDKIEIMDSYLDEEAFRGLLLSADLVALPYTPDRFSNRTSGLLIDSLLLGVPCVVIDETWLAGQVRKLGFGRVVKEDGKSLAAGIRDAVGDIKALQKAALDARDLYAMGNSWSALVAFLNLPKQAHQKAETVKMVSGRWASQDEQESSVRKRMLIIGNGPSTRLLAEAGFDKIPDDMDSWGTTAAYRYFERVGWWPTYYALADRKVVFHHRENFARLINDPKVTSEKFFLSWKVSDNPRLETIPHSSTGSFSLKKAIELGYQEIYLIGMEGAYVEEILESRPLSEKEIAERGFGILNLTKAESKLRIIDKTPTFNPNYFFPGYQEEGDVYSLPQAHTHQANWDSVKEVAAAANAKVINLSMISKIESFERGDIREVFPFLAETCWDDFSDPFAEKAQHAKSFHSVAFDRQFEQKTKNSWRLNLGSEKSGALRAVFSSPGVTEGRRLVAGMTLTASADVKLAVTFGRDGRTKYEGTGQIISIKAGIPTSIVMTHAFTCRHKMMKLQISDVECAGSKLVDFKLDNIWLVESVDSVVARHETEELSARRARIAFEEGNDGYALGAWIHLSHVHKTKRFEDQISKAAQRIGIEGPYSTNRLSELLVRSPLPAQKVPSLMDETVGTTTRHVDGGNPADFRADIRIDKSETGQANARTLVTQAATALLLDPKSGRKSIGEDAMARKLAQALDVLPKDAITVVHYHHVMRFTEHKL
ncbi:MAG: hypothetical protein AAF498_10145 [Pseudomonadota bacterium]